MKKTPQVFDATVSELTAAMSYHLRCSLGRDATKATNKDLLTALSLSLRDQVVGRLVETRKRQAEAYPKKLAYLSMEFLVGRSLDNNLINLGLRSAAEAAVKSFGGSLEVIRDEEPDAALGNGGLGRLAACFLDSLATRDLAATGYGLHYEYGLFKQEIDQGRQREKPDHWGSERSPWVMQRDDESVIVPMYGRIAHEVDSQGQYNPMWVDWKVMVGVPSDFPIVGYGGGTVNALRLFAARSSADFDMQFFSAGDYLQAVEDKLKSENVSKVLYPADNIPAGRELRLVQEYFLVACAVRDMVRAYKRRHATLETFADEVAFQLNDTHPALTVAELMRLWVDEEGMTWEQGWDVTQRCCGYTNHTLMAEALEKWPVDLFEKVLPRHLQIVYEINRRFLYTVSQRWPGDTDRLRRMSIIEEGPVKNVRMANLSIVGSHSVNGVAKLHSDLVKTELVPDFHQLWPERFNNKTNGITQRRWLLQSNPGLAELISSNIGTEWVTQLPQLQRLVPLANDAGFVEQVRRVKAANKARLATKITELTGVKVDPSSMFDVQIKRIHEYKRQLLNIMHVVHSYLQIVEDGVVPPSARTVLFAGKAAPGYYMAKKIIHLINAVGEVVNKDPRANPYLKVAFLPDYRVSLAEQIVPGADLSEQISTAGKEASGTGNMKLSLNGALTIGTLDGANVEIRDEVGAENIIIFGLNVEEVTKLRPHYRPHDLYQNVPAIRRVVDAIGSDRFCADEPGAFRPIVDNLLAHDEYFHFADFESYLEAQGKAAALYADQAAWGRMAVLNIARMGAFSSDRTIDQYAEEIWGLKPVPAKAELPAPPRLQALTG